jgi:hypothetical protein
MSRCICYPRFEYWKQFVYNYSLAIHQRKPTHFDGTKSSRSELRNRSMLPPGMGNNVILLFIPILNLAVLWEEESSSGAGR